jgi:hypothetical protein
MDEGPRLVAFDHPALLSGAPPQGGQHPRIRFVVRAKLANQLVFASETKEVTMRKLLIGSAAAIAAMLAATPAAAQYYGYGYSPYAYGYSPYSYGYSYPSYGYSSYGYGYSPYSYGYSYPSYGYSSYGYGYSPYSYGYSTYGYRSSSNCLHRHHRNGVVWYTRSC